MKNKRKSIILAASILGSVAIVSTGFAAWVISAPATTTVEGNVSVDTVKDERYSLEVSWAENANHNLVFGWADSDPAVSNPWLTHGADDKKENLSVTFTVTVKQGGNVVEGKKPTAIITLTDTDDSDYATAVTGNLITNPSVVVGDATSTGVYPVTVSASWGSAFESQNPYVYYNAKTVAEYGNEALKNLQKIEKLSTVKFSVTLSVSD